MRKTKVTSWIGQGRAWRRRRGSNRSTRCEDTLPCHTLSQVEEISIKTRVQKILDLSSSRLESLDDLETALARIPQYKIKPEKVGHIFNILEVPLSLGELVPSIE